MNLLTGSNSNRKKYFIMPADPATGILYITENSPGFISGHLRMRGKKEVNILTNIQK